MPFRPIFGGKSLARNNKAGVNRGDENMAKPSAEVITTCPHPNCGKPIRSDHLYTWCIECGERLPLAIVSQLPLVQEAAAKGPELESRVEPDVADLNRKIDPTALTYRYRDAYSIARVVISTGNVF